MQSELHALDHRYAQLRQHIYCLGVCADADVPAVFTDVLYSLEQLFAFENLLMDAHHFPAARCHVEQHARVLGGLHRAHAQVMRGQLQQGRHAGTRLLMSWFELHNGTLDACLLVWLDSMQPNHPIPAMPRDTLPPQLMRDLTRKARALWRPLKSSDQSNATGSSRHNRQGSGEQ
jgi:hemerythrin